MRTVKSLARPVGQRATPKVKAQKVPKGPKQKGPNPPANKF